MRPHNKRITDAALPFQAQPKHPTLALVDQSGVKSGYVHGQREKAAEELLLRIVEANSPKMPTHVGGVLQSAVPHELPLNALLDEAKILFWTADSRSSRFTYVSKQAKKMLGYPVKHWYDPGFLPSHVHPDDQSKVFTLCGSYSHIERQCEITFRIFAKNGRVVWLRNLINVDLEEGKVAQVYGFMVDITDRKLADEALLDLGGRLISAQEAERGRIARELHDDVNQRMALLSIELEQLGRGINEPAKQNIFEKLQRQVKDLSSDIHRLSYRLHPSKLDHLGLGAAVNSLCEEFSESAKRKVVCHRSGFPSTLPKDVELCIFRIAQEAVRNSVRHSQAETIRVVLIRTRNAVRLSVSDNGCGFNPKSEVMQSGLGFISMRERLHVVGGEMRVYSQPRRGTRVEVSVPLTEVPVNP
jgi:PAS domain S-box-containing protein